MEKQLEDKNTEMGSVITRSEQFIEKNQKTILIVVAAILVVVLAFFGLRRWYFQPREQHAAEAMFAAEQWYGQSDFQKALDGDENFDGFLGIIDSYNGTKSANIAKYYAGSCYLKLGEFEEANRWLKKYHGKDLYTKPLAMMMRADALIEQGQTKEAAALYCKAAKTNANELTSPSALFKAGMAYVILEDNKAALDCFEQIKTNYPRSTEWNDIDKYIALVETEK